MDSRDSMSLLQDSSLHCVCQLTAWWVGNSTTLYWRTDPCSFYPRLFGISSRAGAYKQLAARPTEYGQPLGIPLCPR